jgi:type I restriction enzyme S subunit
VKLGDVAESVDYGVTASAVDREVGPKFLRITDLQNGGVCWDSVPWCECGERDAAEARLRPGDIVFARTGATTGKSYLIRECPSNTVFASYLIRVRLGSNAEPRFVSHFFQTQAYWAQVAKSARGAAQPGVNATKLKQLKIPLPSLHEQRRIAGILDSACVLQAKRRALNARFTELASSMFFALFGDPALNPMRYPCRPLGELAAKFSDGPFGSNLKTSHYTATGVRVVRLQNIGVGEFLDEDAAFVSEEHFGRLSKHECRPGDVLIGTLGDPNLRACIQPESLPIALNKADCVQLRPNKTIANASYVCALLNQPSVERMAHGLILGQTRLRISMGRLRGLIVPVPPLEQQQEFARRLEAAERHKVLLQSTLTKCDELIASLQGRSFRGEA